MSLFYFVLVRLSIRTWLRLHVWLQTIYSKERKSACWTTWTFDCSFFRSFYVWAMVIRLWPIALSATSCSLTEALCFTCRESAFESSGSFCAVGECVCSRHSHTLWTGRTAVRATGLKWIIPQCLSGSPHPPIVSECTWCGLHPQSQSVWNLAFFCLNTQLCCLWNPIWKRRFSALSVTQLIRALSDPTVSICLWDAILFVYAPLSSL